MAPATTSRNGSATTQTGHATVALDPPPQIRLRVARGMRRPANWLQFARFLVVGASGYAVNLGVFASAVHGARLDYRVAAIGAFLVALTNNFWWNRHWTFAARAVPARFQAAPFLVVSGCAFLVNLAVLWMLVDVLHAPKVGAQAFAVGIAAPVNFLGNRFWSFRSAAGTRLNPRAL